MLQKKYERWEECPISGQDFTSQPDAVREQAYCLFCNTGKEMSVVNYINRETSLGAAYFPQRMKSVLLSKKWAEVPVPLLPGYVFLFSEMEENQVKRLRTANNVIRVLAYSDGSTQLMGRDREFAEWIKRNNGMLNSMKAIEVGSRVEIIDSVFKDLRGTIKKMDKRRRSFLVEIDSEGIFKKIWLSYAMISKID